MTDRKVIKTVPWEWARGEIPSKIKNTNYVFNCLFSKYTNAKYTNTQLANLKIHMSPVSCLLSAGEQDVKTGASSRDNVYSVQNTVHWCAVNSSVHLCAV